MHDATSAEDRAATRVFASYVSGVDARLRSAGYREALVSPQAHEIERLYHKQTAFKLARLNGRDTYFAFGYVPADPALEDVRYFIASATEAAADDRAQRRRRRMRAVTVYAVIAANEYGDDVDSFVAYYPRDAAADVDMTSWMPVPVLVKPTMGCIVRLPKPRLWGIAAYPGIRNEARRLLNERSTGW